MKGRGIGLTDSWLNLVILGVTAGAAVWSAISAMKSNKSEKASQKIAKRQAQLGFAEVVRAWQPAVAMDLMRVQYRWASNRYMWTDTGGPSEPDLAVNESVTISDADDKGVKVEIVLKGCLVNNTSEQMLLTVRGMRGGVRYPLENEGLFVVNGEERSRFILEAHSKQEFTWVDRKSIADWRSIYHATDSGASTVDRKFKHSLDHVKLRQRLFGKRSIDLLDWAARVREQAGFVVVAESRMETRLSTIWHVEPGQSAIIPDFRSTRSESISWKLRPTVKGPIDDDVILYRYFYSSALAQLDPPSIVHLPGRR